MIEKMGQTFEVFYQQNILAYLENLYQSPSKLILLIIDIVLVIFLAVKLLQVVKDTRAWQLLKGIILLILVTILSGLFGLKILNYILTSFMTYGVIILIVIFQPELRRALEQLGTSKLTRFFGIEKDIATRTKENIYKIVIAALELSKNNVGGLIVIERDIKIKDIINTGIVTEAEISPQLLVNIFTPNTPLHDGAAIISGNKIAAVACMLPLASDQYIAKELGTRHRAAIVISEETGKISIAKDGTLIADLKEEALKKILIKNIVTKRFETESRNKRTSLQQIKEKINGKKLKINKEVKNEEHKTND